MVEVYNRLETCYQVFVYFKRTFCLEFVLFTLAWDIYYNYIDVCVIYSGTFYNCIINLDGLQDAVLTIYVVIDVSWSKKKRGEIVISSFIARN